jgi:cytochrome b involved in lipid metabolism
MGAKESHEASAVKSDVSITAEEVAKHCTAEDCWLIIGSPTSGGSFVYDVTRYLSSHPGGAEILLEHAGKNATEAFEDIGHSDSAKSKLLTLRIGKLE